MPLYEYRCTACDRLTEKRQKFSDPEITDCPYCGGKLERTITAPAVQFKGGGWYADGYGSKKPAAASGRESAADSSGPESKESKGDTKVQSSAPPAATASPVTTKTGSNASSTTGSVSTE